MDIRGRLAFARTTSSDTAGARHQTAEARAFAGPCSGQECHTAEELRLQEKIDNLIEKLRAEKSESL